MRRPGEVLSRFALLEGAWDSGYEHRSNVIEARPLPAREGSCSRRSRGSAIAATPPPATGNASTRAPSSLPPTVGCVENRRPLRAASTSVGVSSGTRLSARVLARSSPDASKT